MRTWGCAIFIENFTESHTRLAFTQTFATDFIVQGRSLASRFKFHLSLLFILTLGANVKVNLKR